MKVRDTGGHSTIFAPNCDGGGEPRDAAVTEIGTPYDESSSGRRTRVTIELIDMGRAEGEEDGVACLSVRLWNTGCVCLFVCMVACVLEKRQEERKRRGREENKSIRKCIDFSKNKNKREDRRKSIEAPISHWNSNKNRHHRKYD